MNHIDHYEQIQADDTLIYEMRRTIEYLNTMTMQEMIETRKLVNEFVEHKMNDYLRLKED